MKKRKLMMWAGFVRGEIYRESDYTDGYAATSRPIVLFSTKKDAKIRFRDIRRVEIKEVSRRKGNG